MTQITVRGLARDERPRPPQPCCARAKCFLLLACAMLALQAAPSSAQGIGAAAIFGAVRDTLGRPIAGAAIELRYTPTGTVFRAATDSTGRFQIVDLRPGGPYTLAVRFLGFADQQHVDVMLASNQRLALDLVMREQAIQLDAIEALVDRRFEISRAGPATSVRRDVIRTVPTIERSIMDLAVLSPVAVQTSDQGGMSISGQNERQNAILIDGGLNQDVFGVSTSGTPGAAARAKPLPLDAIEEFRIEVAPFDTRTSGFTGGALNAITRSGTNEWQGSVFGHFRNQDFFGDLVVDGANVAPEEFRRNVFGFNLGGPLKRDVAHVFVAAEFEDRIEPAPGFSLGTHEDIATRIAEDSLARMAQVLESGYGVDPGTARQLFLENPLANVFTRVDLRFGEAHALTLRHNFARAQRDSTPNRASFGAYEFGSTGHRIESTSQAFTGRLVSRFGSGHSNEVSLNVQRIDDRTEPNATFPQIDVRITSAFEDVGFTRRARAGSRYFRQRDQLDQTVLQLGNATTLSRDDIVTTFGGSIDLFRFDQDHQPGALGLYRFDSVRNLEANQPSYYELNVLADDAEASTRFNVVQPSLFVQNEHRFPPELVLQYGIRLDVPLFPQRPEQNIELLDHLGVRTERLPSGPFLLSPRMGFNWQSQRRWTTQLRGGWGIFTGRIPFVWMADAYRHSGLRSAILSCEADNAPGLDPAAPAPRTCVNGDDAFAGQQGTVVTFDPEFYYPRELKVTAALDQQLPWQLYLSAEAFMVQTFGRTVVRDLNTPSPGTPADERYTRAFGPRASYGHPTPLGYAPDRESSAFSQVLMIGNDERSAFAWAFTLELQKQFAAWLDLTGSVTFAGSEDTQSMVFPDMLSNYAATPVGRLVTDLGPAPANFDRPRKYLLNARTRIPASLGGAQISALYVGQSGQVYSYVYGSDINGDGYSGPGVPLDAGNDLVYIPEEPAQIQGTLPTRSLLARLANDVDPCLADVRAAFVPRNSCRAPSTHRLDLRVAQPISLGPVRAELTADVLNVFNLLNSEWGRVWEVDPLIPLLDIVARANVDMSGEYDPNSAPILGYQGSVVRDAETGYRPTLPFNLIVPASQWQAQVGLRLSF